jgi:hypothetical protein
MIGARDDLGPEDVQAGHAETARQLVEKAGPVPGDDIDDREAAVQIVLPVDDRPQRADGVGLVDRLQQPVHHLDVEGDLPSLRVEEIPLGEQVEMRRDLVRADAGDLFCDELFVDHLFSFQVSFIDSGTKQQPIQRGAEKGGMKGIFIAVPKRGGRAAGIAESMHVEIPKVLGIANQIGKGGG